LWAIPFVIIDGIINHNWFERIWHIPLLFYTGTRWFYDLLSIPSWLWGFYYLEYIMRYRNLTMFLIFPLFTFAYFLNTLSTTTSSTSRTQGGVQKP
jgi:hypothetical protein